MIVEQIWVGNSLRNFNYLIACPETGDALAVDPLDHQKCLSLARQRGWQIRQIVNTHEHGDHTGGNRPLVAATGARLLAHANARISGVDQGLNAGDTIKVGNSVTLVVLDTPGHTMSHVCLLSRAEPSALFCGDTLFNAGAGNCHNGGHPKELYKTFVQQLAQLPDSTRIYPGHDYLANNLAFTLDREPDNQTAAALVEKARNQDPANALVTTIGQEKQINVFFRLGNASVIKRLRDNFSGLPSEPTAEEVFLKLRELRNTW